MKKLLQIFVVALCVTVASGCASPRTGNKTGERFDSAADALPSFNHVTGHGVNGQCDPFAKSAVAMLHARGIPAHRITYGWAHFGTERGYHAAVLFQLNGKFYFMDNQHQRPQICGQTTDLGCVYHVAGGAFGSFYWMTDENNARVAPRMMKDLFAPAPAWLQPLQASKQ